jgi:transposase
VQQMGYWNLGLPPGTPVNWLATQPVDMRTGIDGLSLHVQQTLGRAPCDGTVYVFSNRHHTRLKMVCWDGNGVWMCLPRLHHGEFTWSQPGDDACELSQAQWRWLVAGVDWQRLSAQPAAHGQFSTWRWQVNIMSMDLFAELTAPTLNLP